MAIDWAAWHDLARVLPVAVAHVDLDGVIRYANPAVHRLFGGPYDGLVGRRVQTLACDDDARADVDRSLRDHTDTGSEEGHAIWRCRRLDESVLEVRADWSVARDEGGQVQGIILALTDASPQRASEQALREAKAELERVMRSIPDYLWSAQIDADGTFGYRFYSPVVEKITGRPPSFFLASPERWLSTVHPEDRPRMGDAAGRLIAGVSEQEIGDYRILLPDGGIRWVRDRVVAERSPDGSMRLHGVVSDITERHRVEEETRHLEAQLQQLQKLESLGRLAGGVAHDFNNMLTAIMGNATLARDRIAGESDLRGLIDGIVRAGERLSELTAQLLAFTGRGTQELVPIELPRVVEEILHLVEPSLPSHVHLEFHTARDLPRIEADASQLQQVVMNLVLNAVDALGGELGTVTVRTGRVRVGSEMPADLVSPTRLAPGDYVSLIVRDTGCGMTDKTRARIFDPFFSTKPEGRGLGLASVLGIVRSHGGGLWIDSAPGQGATFRVLFRLAEPDAVAAEASPSRPAAGHGTVLIADDEPIVRTVLRTILETLGYEVVETTGGVEAVRVFTEDVGRFRLAVLDVLMPDMGGREVLSRLRALRPDLPVILSTGLDSVDAGAKPLQERVAILAKPYTPEELEACVDGLLQREP